MEISAKSLIINGSYFNLYNTISYHLNHNYNIPHLQEEGILQVSILILSHSSDSLS